ncbi:hypothetical protein [Halorussus marinus]|uniref:hypothetical protein n=1 Tax=Halorussus marinus TaxID=2505976 RepID=UPI001092BED5|nr:hypothetical protein [Halorussus marinus]
MPEPTDATEQDTEDEASTDIHEDYDIDAPLRERLPVMADIQGGIELHAGDDRGVVEVLGRPHTIDEHVSGSMELRAGGRSDNWNYEIVVPAENTERGAFVREVDPMQPYEDYIDTRRIALDDVDVRIYGVDDDRLEDTQEVASGD